MGVLPVHIRQRAFEGKRPMPLRWRTEIGAIRYALIACGVLFAALCFLIPFLLVPFGVSWNPLMGDSASVLFGTWGIVNIAAHFAEKRSLAQFEARLDRGDRPCPACGFDVAGVAEDAHGLYHCPECGVEVLPPEELTRYWRATLWFDRSQHLGYRAAKAYQAQAKGAYQLSNQSKPESAGAGPRAAGATAADAGR
ncbi:MAG: hypothetical protein EA378_06430 [Phycisphaerales bacterium]|nr:MAG: hypothetical protein EA378_06430 [Phycisphaerales bacterium]